MAASEKEHLVITAVGPDRVGLVEQIAQFLLKDGCNIEDSKMAVFCGEFTIILLVSGSVSALARVSNSFDQLTNQTGLQFFGKKASPKLQAGSALPCRLLASCLDHPGVVHQVSSVLSALGVNIESMETTAREAPMSVSPLFQMEALLTVPAAENLHVLRSQLDEIGRRENIDIELVVSGKTKND
jgi:glycine cleavage system transcriptional repressor